MIWFASASPILTKLLRRSGRTRIENLRLRPDLVLTGSFDSFLATFVVGQLVFQSLALRQVDPPGPSPTAPLVLDGKWQASTVFIWQTGSEAMTWPPGQLSTTMALKRSLIETSEFASCPKAAQADRPSESSRATSRSDHRRNMMRLHVTTSKGDPMATASPSRSSRDKVRAHRARLRKQGLRPIQIWVPDVRSKAFAREAHRQSLAVANSPHVKEDQAFVDAISAWDEPARLQR
jgi:hypothetical protein